MKPLFQDVSQLDRLSSIRPAEKDRFLICAFSLAVRAVIRGALHIRAVHFFVQLIANKLQIFLVLAEDFVLVVIRIVVLPPRARPNCIFQLGVLCVQDVSLGADPLMLNGWAQHLILRGLLEAALSRELRQVEAG